MIVELIIGGAVAAGTYNFAKKKRASTGQSAAAAAATGAASAGATWMALVMLAWMWPVFIIGGAVAGGYLIGKKKQPKALPPAPDV
jgi:hypothetical protein